MNTKSKLLYPPMVYDHNTEQARATGEPEHVPYDCFLEARRTKHVGDIVRHYAGAPGIGHTDYRIDRIDDSGVWATEIESTVRVLDPSEVI